MDKTKDLEITATVVSDKAQTMVALDKELQTEVSEINLVQEILILNKDQTTNTHHSNLNQDTEMIAEQDQATMVVSDQEAQTLVAAVEVLDLAAVLLAAVAVSDLAAEAAVSDLAVDNN